MNNIFHEDLWLSGQLSKNVYRLNLDSFTKNNFLLYWKNFKIKNSKENYFIYSKIKSNCVKDWQTIEGVGFKLIDTNIELALNKPIIYKNNFVDFKIKQKDHQSGDRLIAIMILAVFCTIFWACFDTFKH